MTSPTSPEAVVLLHGLCRTRRSMIPMERALAAEGSDTWNVGYPSRTRSIADLADQVIPDALARCRDAAAPARAPSTSSPIRWAGSWSGRGRPRRRSPTSATW